MKTAILFAAFLGLFLAVGCTGDQSRDLGIKGLELYYGALVGSPFWPGGVEKPNAAVIGALASTTWDAGDWAVARAKEELKQD